MTSLYEVPLNPYSLNRFRPILGDERVREVERVGTALAARLAGRTLWQINSTARGGGVAEMLPSLLGYARGAGIDTRWLVAEGSPQFFGITKRLHHALHGSSGDASALGDGEREVYERVLHANAHELEALIRPRDIVVLHDPQTAGLAPALLRFGAIVVWRCHIGADTSNEQVELGWAFLAPYLGDVAAMIFSRPAYIPAWCEPGRAVVIQPSIDAFSPKNQDLNEATTRTILVQAGLIEGPSGSGLPVFLKDDGTPGRVDRQADIMRLGRAPTWEAPLVVQISRWDPLKDHVGVMRGFVDLVDGAAPAGAELVLAGPSVTAVADDPESIATFNQVVAAWRELPHGDRHRVQLACLPMADVAENAAIVNAFQRHATVVVQKSLHEGFGLTVTEAMWKGRPVVASAVGGIRDQIVDGEHGLLVDDPTQLAEFAADLRQLLADQPLDERLGANARERVRDDFLGPRHLLDYAQLIERVAG